VVVFPSTRVRSENLSGSPVSSRLWHSRGRRFSEIQPQKRQCLFLKRLFSFLGGGWRYDLTWLKQTKRRRPHIPLRTSESVTGNFLLQKLIERKKTFLFLPESGFGLKIVRSEIHPLTVNGLWVQVTAGAQVHFRSKTSHTNRKSNWGTGPLYNFNNTTWVMSG